MFEVKIEITTSTMTFQLNGVKFDRYITALKQLLLLAQKYGALYLIAAKMQPH